MFYEKELFCARWYKSIKKSKTVYCIGGCFCNPDCVGDTQSIGYLSFEKSNTYFIKITNWLNDHDIEYDLNDGEGTQDIIIKIIFKF